MKKMKCLFQRDFSVKPTELLNSITSGCEWVIEGNGIPSEKIDGTAVMIDTQGVYWKRYDAKKGKTPLVGFLEVTKKLKNSTLS